MTVTLRPFAAADQPAVRSLILAGLAEHFAELDAGCNPDLADIRQSYLLSGHVFIVAEQEGALVGTGGLLITEREGQLVRVSVARTHRGQGLGRCLVEHLVATARSRGLARVWMETNDDWGPALALYAACGFHEFDRRDGCVFMERILATSDRGLRTVE